MIEIAYLPEELAERLVNAGLAAETVGSDEKAAVGAEIVTAALVVLNTAGSGITLLAARDQVRELVSHVLWWRHRQAQTKTFVLEARGPKGKVTFELDEKPDIEALSDFLEKALFGE